jgi:hypothetical protein
MAELGAFFGNPNIQRQGARARALAGQRDVNTLPDPLTYAVMQGLLGTRPDEMGFSVLNPDYEKIKKVAEPAFALGLLGQAAPALAPLTKGLPVGASILDVGKSASKSIVREGNPIQSAVVLIGDKIFTGRTHTEAFNRAIYEGVVRKEGGKFIYPKNAEVNSDLFMTKDGQIIDRIQASKMFDIGASETAIKEGLMQNKPASSMTVDSYIKQAEKLKKQKKSAPRQEALDTAQRNAALPIEEGGLGLPKDNTPEMRAEAMGFDVSNPQYHATNVPEDFTSIRPSARGKMGAGIYTSPEAKYAEKYGGNQDVRILPMVSRGEYADADSRENIFDMVRGELYQKNPNFTSQELNNAVSQEMQKKGYSGFDVDKERVTFNPDEMRSQFAAFDPFRMNTETASARGVAPPDLLAGVLPLGLLTDEDQRKKLYELMPSLLGQ